MKIKTLEAYTKANNELRDFSQKHSKIFEQYEALKSKVSEAETELKKDVKENYKDTIANDFVRVGYSLPTSKGYNSEVLFSLIKPAQKKKLIDLGAIVISENVDSNKLSDAIEQGIVEKEVCEKAFEEKELAPRVTITLKK